MSQQNSTTTETSEEKPVSTPKSVERKKPKKMSQALQRRPEPEEESEEEDSEMEMLNNAPGLRKGRRMVPVHQSRIKDRVTRKGAEESSLKIKIELDLEVEVEIYARVKGDITIGLM